MSVRHGPDTTVLAGVPPFDRYRERSLRPLAAHADRLRLRAGTTLAWEGHRVRELVVVLEGEVAGCRGGQAAGRFGPGACFGAIELVEGTAHPVTLEATTEVEVLVVAGPAYRWAVQELRPRRREPAIRRG